MGCSIMYQDIRKKQTIRVYLEPEDRIINWYNHIRAWSTPSLRIGGHYTYYTEDETLFGVIRNGEFIYVNDLKSRKL